MAHNDAEKGSYETSGHLSAPKPRPSSIANPATLGLFSFASTTLMLSLYNAQARGIHTSNVVIGMAIFCGGLAQFLAGMWEFPRGNAFGATAFTSYGAFWMSFATIFIPGSGVLTAYKDKDHELQAALAIYLFAWFMVTFFLFICVLRKSIAFILLFGFLAITFLVLSISHFTINVKFTKAGGILGCVTALIAYYIGLADLLATDRHAPFQLPLGVFTHD